MKPKNFKSHKAYFESVAIATLLCGAVILALGSVELILNLWSNYGFSHPAFKIIGGLVVLSLGYIHLELELIRIK